MVCPRRAGVPFGLPHKKEPKKVTAEGTGLPWLALRRREANSPTLGVRRQVPPVAPDAAPSARPNPLRGSLEYPYVLVTLIKKNAALVERALRNPQTRAVKGHLLFEARRAELRGPRLEARILVSATTAAKFFAYFLTPKSRAPLAKRPSFFASFWRGITFFLRFLLPLFWESMKIISPSA